MDVTRSTALAAIVSFGAILHGANWPQFRGPNGSGVAEEAMDLAIEFGPGKNLAWSAALPAGMSSPVVVGSRIYLTGLREKALVTIALDRATGKVLWEKPAPAARIEETHDTSSPAASTPASDGERVAVFFGSFGLLCYDPGGKENWRLPLGPFKNPFGQSSSPIISGGLVILNCDQDLGSFLLAVDKATGRERWRTERPEFPRGYSTPIIWETDGARQLVVAGTLRIKGYEVETGRELWSKDGLARIVNPTPVQGGGLLYMASFSPGGDAGERISMQPFEDYAKTHDADKNGRFTKEEVTEPEMKQRFLQIDADKDGFITRAEWENMVRIFDDARNSIIALGPESPGSAAVSVAWTYERAIPYVPTPVYHEGHIYMVKDGGIFTALDAKTGKVAKQGRLPAGGGYYASPVIGGGNLYASSLGGDVVVVSAAGSDWEVRAANSLGERIAATPAIADGRLYVRTEKRLYAFGAQGAEKKAGGAAR